MAQRAGDKVLNRSGRLSNDNTFRGRMPRPSATRCHAASKRSSASPAAPSRISSGLDIALEVIAKLLHRAEAIARIWLVDHAAPPQAIAQVVVQLDVEDSLRRDHGFPQEQHMAYRTIYRVR